MSKYNIKDVIGLEFLLESTCTRGQRISILNLLFVLSAPVAYTSDSRSLPHEHVLGRLLNVLSIVF